MEEEWRGVIGYEAFYVVNTNGNVKSLDRMVVTASGAIRCLKSKPIKTRINNFGYIEIRLSKNGVTKTHFIHRILVEAYVGIIGKGLEINHIDGNPQNNSLDNLEIVTHSENIKHAYEDGLISLKSRLIIDNCSGEIFPSLRAASISSKIYYRTLKAYLDGHKRNPTPLEYIH